MYSIHSFRDHFLVFSTASILKTDTVELSNAQWKTCIPVFLMEDNGKEDKHFKCILSQNIIPNSFSNVKLERDIATIKIQDTPSG